MNEDNIHEKQHHLALFTILRIHQNYISLTWSTSSALFLLFLIFSVLPSPLSHPHKHTLWLSDLAEVEQGQYHNSSVQWSRREYSRYSYHVLSIHTDFCAWFLYTWCISSWISVHVLVDCREDFPHWEHEELVLMVTLNRCFVTM